MAAISVSFSPKVATDWDPQKPLTTTKLNQLYDNTEFVKQWLGQSYVGGAVQNHSHDGLDSALIPVGANELRNGSFESGTTGWTITQYTGGTVAINAANNLNGVNALAFTSTVLANGGGDALSNEYVPVTGGSSHSISAAVKAAVANLSGKIEINFYDNTQALISTAVVYTSNNLPTTSTQIGGSVVAPATARFKRIRVTGNIAGSVGPVTIGTVYFDGLVSSQSQVVSAGANYLNIAPSCVAGVYSTASNTSSSAIELFNMRIMQYGIYRCSFTHSNSGGSSNTQIYKNGVAVGTLRTSTTGVTASFTEDLTFAVGDSVQFYSYVALGTVILRDVRVGIDKTVIAAALPLPPVVPLLIGDR